MAGQVYRQGGHSRTQLASDEMASPRLEVDKAEAAKAASEQKVRGVSLVVLNRLQHKNKKRLLVANYYLTSFIILTITQYC
jgi:hypothetical protein